MASARRRKSLALIDKLRAEPYSFEFFQAVRLLEIATQQDASEQYAKAPVAQHAPPAKELVRFTASNKLSYAGADVLSLSTEVNGLESPDQEAQLRWLMNVSFFGQGGAQGVLPIRYTELILQELKNKNESLSDFIDLFNHRSISLYYQAWHKYRLPVNFERSRNQNNGNHDKFTQALLSLAGIGTSELQYRLPFQDELLAGFAGSLSRSQRTADQLKSLVYQMFGLDIDIQQFKGQWQPLDQEVACQLPGPENSLGVNNQLGVNAIIGTECYHAQSKFSVVVAPLPYKRFMELAPGTKKLESLKSLIRMSVGMELEFDISVTTSHSQVPPTRLVEEPDYQPSLGWNSHLHSDSVLSIEPMNINLSHDMHTPEEGIPLYI
jgi:type VI secretion system protein ImpH